MAIDKKININLKMVYKINPSTGKIIGLKVRHFLFVTNQSMFSPSMNITMHEMVSTDL